MIHLRILSRSDGQPTKFDDKFVKVYDPAFHPPGERYDGGLLEVTDDPEQALQFHTPEQAFACWRQSHGIRPHDGLPNRPLTAFCVEIS